MKYKAKAMFLHDQLGRVNAGDIFEANDAQIAAVRDAVEVYETKVIKQESDNVDVGRNKRSPSNRSSGRK